MAESALKMGLRRKAKEGEEGRRRRKKEVERKGAQCIAKYCERLYALYGCSGCAHANSWQRCREEEGEGLPYSHGIPVSKKKQTKQRAKKRTKSVNRFASLHKRPPRPSLGFSTEPDAPTPSPLLPPVASTVPQHLCRRQTINKTTKRSAAVAVAVDVAVGDGVVVVNIIFLFLLQFFNRERA